MSFFFLVLLFSFSSGEWEKNLFGENKRWGPKNIRITFLTKFTSSNETFSFLMALSETDFPLLLFDSFESRRKVKSPRNQSAGWLSTTSEFVVMGEKAENYILAECLPSVRLCMLKALQRFTTSSLSSHCHPHTNWWRLMKQRLMRTKSIPFHALSHNSFPPSRMESSPQTGNKAAFSLSGHSKVFLLRTQEKLSFNFPFLTFVWIFLSFF